MPLEPIAGGRFWCPCCAKDFAAVRDSKGDFVFDLRPLRYLARRSRAS